MDSPTVCVSPRANEVSPSSQPAPADVPIYVDVSTLQEKHLTGMGRFVAQLVRALAQRTPLGLLTTATGEYIPLSCLDAAESDPDLERWAQWVLRRPRRTLEDRSVKKCAVVYTALRP